ncbi:MAG: ABC transporter permease [Lachnospiraceae bacterium]|nr:ABC transporter permease [Lachnospiraceae bacterium]
MKSKISVFSLTLCKRNIKVNLMGTLVYLAMMIYVGPVSYYFQVRGQSADISSQELTALKRWALVSWNMSGQMWLIAAFAVLTALVSFYYLFDKRANQMLHAMPFTRTQMFITNYVSGLFMQLLVLFISAGVMEAVVNDSMYANAVMKIYGISAIATVFFYSLSVLLCMICGVVYLPPVLFMVANLLYVVYKGVFNMIASALIYGYNKEVTLYASDYLDISNAWSPLVYLSTVNYFNGDEQGKLYTFPMGYKVLWYLFFAVLLTVFTWFVYKRRPAERCGDFLTKPWLNVAVSVICTLGISMGLMMAILDVEVNKYVIRRMGIANVCFVLMITFLVYLLLSMIIGRSKDIMRKRIMIPAVVMTVVCCVGFAVIQVDALGISKKVPEKNEIKGCYISTDFTGNKPLKNNVDETLEIHKRMIKEQKNIENQRPEIGVNIVIQYHLKNGKTLERTYVVPYEAAELENPDSLTYLVDNKLNNFEKYCGHLYNRKPYEAILHLSKFVDENGNYKEVELDAKGVKKALIKDVKAGALRMDYPEWGLEKTVNWPEKERFCSEDYIELKFASIDTEAEELYGNLSGYSTGIWNYSSEEDLNIKKEEVLQFYLNKKCKNLLKYLEQSGVKNSEINYQVIQ